MKIARLVNDTEGQEWLGYEYGGYPKAEDESTSIQTQKAMLTDHCRDKGYRIVDYYVDDGETGTNFERPEFQRMLRDIETGKINTVICKDLSRFGRNYYEAEQKEQQTIISEYETQKDTNTIKKFFHHSNGVFVQKTPEKFGRQDGWNYLTLYLVSHKIILYICTRNKMERKDEYEKSNRMAAGTGTDRSCLHWCYSCLPDGHRRRCERHDIGQGQDRAAGV